MYCVFDKVTKNKNGHLGDGSMLACFDYMGHGIVYDRSGKTRLKYNQSEGILLDSHIGPPARWKWHTLNEPPILIGVYENKYLRPYDKCLDQLAYELEINKNVIKDKMYEIELNNMIRDNLKKFSIKYKRLEIRPIFFKINDYFSLNIVSQSKIYLQFKDCETSLKLNIGLNLLNNEIVGVETVDVTEVVQDCKEWNLNDTRI